jgi:hypothetical protein
MRKERGEGREAGRRGVWVGKKSRPTTWLGYTGRKEGEMGWG